jgi:DNA-binding PadR family transcriptional regulator
MEEPRPKPRRITGPMGPFEYLVMKTVVRLLREEKDTFGLAISATVEKLVAHKLDPRHVLVILQRLRNKGYLSAKRARKKHGARHIVSVHSLTNAGKKAMEESATFYRLLQDDPEDTKRAR